MASRRWPTKLVMSWEAVGDVQLCTCKEVWNFWQAVILGMFWESFELQCVTCWQVHPLSTCWQVHPLSAHVASDLVRPFRSIKASTSSSPYIESHCVPYGTISECVLGTCSRSSVPSVGFAWHRNLTVQSRGAESRGEPRAGVVYTQSVVGVRSSYGIGARHRLAHGVDDGLHAPWKCTQIHRRFCAHSHALGFLLINSTIPSPLPSPTHPMALATCSHPHLQDLRIRLRHRKLWADGGRGWCFRTLSCPGVGAILLWNRWSCAWSKWA